MAIRPAQHGVEDSSAHLNPGSGGNADAVAVGIVNGHTRVGVGVEGYVRRLAIAGRLHSGLVRWLGLVLALAAVAAAPGGFAYIGVGAAIDCQGRSADRDDIGREGRQSPDPPASPVAAKNVTFAWPAGVVKFES